jgi:hypothetical protein
LEVALVRWREAARVGLYVVVKLIDIYESIAFTCQKGGEEGGGERRKEG